MWSENARSLTENIYGDGPDRCSSHSPALGMVAAEEGDLQPKLLRSAVGTSRWHALVEGLEGNASMSKQESRIRKARSLKSSQDLLVSLFASPQAWSVVISEAQEVVIRHQTLNRVTHHIYIHRLLLHPISLKKWRNRLLNASFETNYVLTHGALPLGKTGNAWRWHKSVFRICLNDASTIRINYPQTWSW